MSESKNLEASQEKKKNSKLLKINEEIKANVNGRPKRKIKQIQKFNL